MKILLWFAVFGAVLTVFLGFAGMFVERFDTYFLAVNSAFFTLGTYFFLWQDVLPIAEVMDSMLVVASILGLLFLIRVLFWLVSAVGGGDSSIGANKGN